MALGNVLAEEEREDLARLLDWLIILYIRPNMEKKQMARRKEVYRDKRETKLIDKNKLCSGDTAKIITKKLHPK